MKNLSFSVNEETIQRMQRLKKELLKLPEYAIHGKISTSRLIRIALVRGLESLEKDIKASGTDEAEPGIFDQM